jgi:oligoendopeptidase F
LRDLLADPIDQNMAAELARLSELAAGLEAERPRLAEGYPVEAWLEALKQFEEIGRVSGRLSAYAYLWFTEDTQNPAALSLRGQLSPQLAEISNRLIFLSLWFKDLSDQDARPYLEASGELRYFLETMRRFKPHTLTEAEEKIINIKDVNGIDAIIDLYDMITNRYSFNLEVDGQSQALTRDALSVHFRSPDGHTRQAAYQELNRVYAADATLLAQIYTHRARDWHAEGLELRKYATPIAARNLMNDLPDAVVDTLLDVCRQNTGIFQRYFRLKAGWIGMDRLRRYDIYAPLAQSDKSFPYQHGVELVLDSFQRFSPQVAVQAQRVFAENHLDSEVRPGKRGGAFCYSVAPEMTPWVLTNYAGKGRDIATLAHELGHAVHSMQAAQHSMLTFRPSMPLAETASVFAEMLLTERLLSEEPDPAVRRDLLAHAIDDAYATIQRQAYFTIFERDAHRLIAEGKTVDELSAFYLENLNEQFGDALELADEFRYEWVAIPHIYHSPFYTYSYSFGQLLVLALYQQYRVQGQAFVPRYLGILAAGGSRSPSDILLSAGIDINTAAFWQGGFDVLAGMIDQLEAL